MKKWLPKLWVVLPLLLLTGSMVTAWQIVKPDKVTAIVSCDGAQASNFACWKQHYTQVVSQQSPEAAFVEAKAAFQTNPFLQSNCHQLSHVIGRVAATKYTTLTETYAHGDNFCASGYYHGVIETVAKQIGATKILSQVNNICAPFKKAKPYSLDHYNCVHGMGHGIMAIESDDIYKSLPVCDGYSDSWEQQSCDSGVFMENVMTELNPGEHSKYLKSDDLMYPCTAVADKYKSPCYLIQPSHALRALGYDFSKLFNLCSQVGAPYDAICYQSEGRDISGSSISNQETTLRNCSLGPTSYARQNCFIGAVKDFIYFHHDDKAGLALCAAVPDTAIAQSCSINAQGYYGTF
jgi:hypothetical protein